jgi:DNA-binding XRE family transcriptional regulator
MVTRIRQLLEHKQLSPTQFADAIGVGRPVMSHILSERNKPSLEVVQRIIDAFPEISMAWLLRGTGEMLESGAVFPPEAPMPAAQEPPLIPPALAPAAVPLQNIPDTLAEPPAPVTGPVLAPPTTELSSPVGETRVEPAAIEATLPPIVSATVAPVQVELPAASTLSAGLPPPATLKPFKAKRFVPSGTSAASVQAALPTAAPASGAPVTPVAAVAPLVASPVTPAPFVAASLPVEASPVPAASLAPPVSATPSPEAALLPFLGESGKAIRRIVIFYRDGSFADYQPEQ